MLGEAAKAGAFGAAAGPLAPVAGAVAARLLEAAGDGGVRDAVSAGGPSHPQYAAFANSVWALAALVRGRMGARVGVLAVRVCVEGGGGRVCVCVWGGGQKLLRWLSLVGAVPTAVRFSGESLL
jgi:hypothetical protein